MEGQQEGQPKSRLLSRVRGALSSLLRETLVIPDKVDPREITPDKVAQKILGVVNSELAGGGPLIAERIEQELGYENSIPEVTKAVSKNLSTLVEMGALKETLFDYNRANKDMPGFLVVDRNLLEQIANGTLRVDASRNKTPKSVVD